MKKTNPTTERTYQSPEAEILFLSDEDAITTSTPIADLNAPELPLIMFE